MERVELACEAFKMESELAPLRHPFPAVLEALHFLLRLIQPYQSLLVARKNLISICLMAEKGKYEP